MITIPLKENEFITVCLSDLELKITVIGSPQTGWELYAINDNYRYVFHTARNSIRSWSSLDTLYRFLDSSLDLPSGVIIPVVFDPEGVFS